MDMALLEKIEEQAIYIIQLKEEKDKEIAELKARLAALEVQKPSLIKPQ